MTIIRNFLQQDPIFKHNVSYRFVFHQIFHYDNYLSQNVYFQKSGGEQHIILETNNFILQALFDFVRRSFMSF